MKKQPILCAVLLLLTLLAACAAPAQTDPPSGTPLPTAEAPSGSPAPEPTQPTEEAPLSDKVPMVMVNGILYYDTGEDSTMEGRCGMMDGEITSSVDASQTPTEDDQSNFGSGYGYQYGTEGTIEVNINGQWLVFSAASETLSN